VKAPSEAVDALLLKGLGKALDMDGEDQGTALTLTSWALARRASEGLPASPETAALLTRVASEVGESHDPKRFAAARLAVVWFWVKKDRESLEALAKGRRRAVVCGQSKWDVLREGDAALEGLTWGSPSQGWDGSAEGLGREQARYRDVVHDAACWAELALGSL
jgi:hypothetical protein